MDLLDIYPPRTATHIKPTLATDAWQLEIPLDEGRQTGPEILCYVRVRSKAMILAGCDRCPIRHSPTNKECSANGVHRAYPPIYYLKTGTELEGRFGDIHWNKPPSKAGRVILYLAKKYI
jgi:hypothetical protein